MSTQQWDVFISHASEDKESVARPLQTLLTNAGLRVWLDVDELTLGDSLRRRIDDGLAQSRFGLVVLSPAFFSKEWPQNELNGLFALEAVRGKVILPVWHQADMKFIALYSPILADRLGISTSRGLEAVADEILKAVGHGAAGHDASGRPTRRLWRGRRGVVVTVVAAVLAFLTFGLLEPFLERPYLFAVGYVESSETKADNLDQFSTGIIKRLVRRIPLQQSGRHRIAITPDGLTLLVTNAGSSSVSMIDRLNPNSQRRVITGDYPEFATVTPDGRTALVSNLRSNTVSVVDIAAGRKIRPDIPVPNPGRAVFTPDASRAYVVSGGSWDKQPVLGTVFLINMNDDSVVPIPLTGCSPNGIALTKNGDGALVTNYDSDSVSVISQNGQVTNINIDPENRGELDKSDPPCSRNKAPYHPIDILRSKDGALAYVATDSEFGIEILSLATNKFLRKRSGQEPLFGGENPRNLALSADGQQLYVASWQSPTILIFSLKIPAAPVRVGEIHIPGFQESRYRRDSVTAFR